MSGDVPVRASETGLDAETLRHTFELAIADGEFGLWSRGWATTLRIESGARSWTIGIDCDLEVGGRTAVEFVDPGAQAPAITISGSDHEWDHLLDPEPVPPYADFFSAERLGRFSVSPSPATASVYNSLRRLAWLLRIARNGLATAPEPTRSRHPHGEVEAVVGRYVHVDIDHVDHRIYFEENGSGIPLICHHTAAADARQWRHLLADPWVAEHFRVIAFDLPWHGRSLPPEGTAWWAHEYRLTVESAMANVIGLSDALRLDRPVFLGSSIGGMLALDLARYHPDSFRAVIAAQGGLRSSGGLTPEGAARMARYRISERVTDPSLQAARMMSNMSPTAPEASRQETMLVYQQAAPGVNAGDLYFHAVDHDLRDEVDAIDPARCPIFMLTGEYDATMVPITEDAAAAIGGIEPTIMTGLGHFPMSEDHERFMSYLRPVLEGLLD